MMAEAPQLPVVATETAATALRGTLRRADAEIEELFVFWRDLLSSPRARLDNNRKKKVGERLKDGYSIEDLKLAIIGCALSEWHRGSNDRHTRYQDIELICRDAGHVDRFIEIAEREGRRIQAEREKRAAKEEEAAAGKAVDPGVLSNFRELLDKMRKRNGH